jgi:hypothetical protein
MEECIKEKYDQENQQNKTKIKLNYKEERQHKKGKGSKTIEARKERRMKQLWKAEN